MGQSLGLLFRAGLAGWLPAWEGVSPGSFIYKRNQQLQPITFNDSTISSCLQMKLKPTSPFPYTNMPNPQNPTVQIHGDLLWGGGGRWCLRCVVGEGAWEGGLVSH